MASKPKYNPDDVERWVTVRGARIPIMKDGTFGVGTMDVRTKDGKVVKTDTTINQAAKMELMAAKNPPRNLDPAAKEMLNNINYKELKKNVTSKATYNPDELGLKTTSRNAKYDTSRTKNNSGGKKPSSLEAFKENSNQFVQALKQAEKQGALEFEFTDMTGKVFHRWWDGAKFVDKKVSQSMERRYGKRSGTFKSSFKKPDDWE